MTSNSQEKTMKKLAMALGTLAVVALPSAFAQDNSDRPYPYDPGAVARQQQLERAYGPYAVPQDRRHLSVPGQEPWYEDPGTDGRFTTPDYATRRGYAYRDDRFNNRFDNQECWNPRARHYEAVRPGERQDDLDFSRCRREQWRR
jgi:hypothetical protein